MKVKKGKKVVIINESLLNRYLALGYEKVEENKNENVSAHVVSRKKK